MPGGSGEGDEEVAVADLLGDDPDDPRAKPAAPARHRAVRLGLGGAELDLGPQCRLGTGDVDGEPVEVAEGDRHLGERVDRREPACEHGDGEVVGVVEVGADEAVLEGRRRSEPWPRRASPGSAEAGGRAPGPGGCPRPRRRRGPRGSAAPRTRRGRGAARCGAGRRRGRSGRARRRPPGSPRRGRPCRAR